MQRLGLLLDITSICSRWRQIAIQSPILWTTIAIVPDLVTQSVEVGRAIVEAYIERSKNASLEIYLYLADALADSWRYKFPQVFKALKPHLSRCSTLRVEWSESRMNSRLLPRVFPLQGMPRLKRLRVAAQTTNPTPLTIFAESLPPPNLTSLEIAGLAIAPSDCDSIHDLTISDDARSFGDANPITKIRLPQLVYLSQSGFSADKFLEMPSLEHLSWKRMRFRRFNELLSFPTLKYLSIHSPSIYELHFLTENAPPRFHMPLLEELDIYDAQATTLLEPLLLPSRADILVSGETGKIPFPNLCRLGLWETNDYALGKFLAVIEAILWAYPSLTLQYQEFKTFPRGNVTFWRELEEKFENRVFSLPSSHILLDWGAHAGCKY
ncbi:hypothetical protein DL93DRAFT_2081611 [Clavulina sp. PMI_390]|nr:hypothetical protein DL93DRAFT_2081611 [Clavulina sp. PMI_390]